MPDQDSNMPLDLPDWVTFPEDDWVRITPAEAGLDPRTGSMRSSAAWTSGEPTSGARTTPATSGARC